MFKGISQKNSLLKRQAHPVARNSVDRAGSISDERHASACNSRKLVQRGRISQLSGHRRRVMKFLCKPRELWQGFTDAEACVPGEHGHAHFTCSGRGCQHLTILPPVYVHKIRPGSNAKVLAKAESFTARAHRTQLRPSTDK